MNKKFLFVWLTFVALRISAQTIVLAEYRSNNNPTSGQSGAAGAFGVTATGVTRGPGVSYAGGSDYSAQYWTTGYFYDPNDYYQFTIAPKPGYKISLTYLQFNFIRNTGGPSRIEVRTSLDGYASLIYSDNAIGTGNNGTSFSLGNRFPNLTGSVTFRVYGCRATSPYGTLRVGAYVGYTKVLLPSGALAGIVIKGTRTQTSAPEEGNYEERNSLTDENIAVFPNPTSNVLSIQTKMGNAPVALSIITSLGQTIFSKEIEDGNVDERVDLVQQPSGVYFVKLEAGDLVRIRKVLLKTN